MAVAKEREREEGGRRGRRGISLSDILDVESWTTTIEVLVSHRFPSCVHSFATLHAPTQLRNIFNLWSPSGVRSKVFKNFFRKNVRLGERA